MSVLFSGIIIVNCDQPVYSPSNRYVAFNREGSLIVRDVKNSKEYKYNTHNTFFGDIFNYRFSPDEKYVAFDLSVVGLTSSRTSHVKVWEFKTGRVIVLKNDITTFCDWK